MRQGLDLGSAAGAAFPSIYPLIHDQLMSEKNCEFLGLAMIQRVASKTAV
jgi:hypothetical protein